MSNEKWISVASGFFDTSDRFKGGVSIRYALNQYSAVLIAVKKEDSFFRLNLVGKE